MGAQQQQPPRPASHTRGNPPGSQLVGRGPSRLLCRLSWRRRCSVEALPPEHRPGGGGVFPMAQTPKGAGRGWGERKARGARPCAGCGAAPRLCGATCPANGSGVTAKAKRTNPRAVDVSEAIPQRFTFRCDERKSTP